MRSHILMIGAGLLLLVTAVSSSAAVNCKQVKKYLDTGRSVKDVAETMVIDEKDVKKCQDEAASEPKAGDAKGGGEMKGGQEGGAK